MISSTLVTLAVFCLSGVQGAPSSAVGKTPALGWNTWNAYQGNINAQKVLSAANSIVSMGLKDAGYQYVNIDDCWASMNRDSSKRMVPDPAKFPQGISGVAQQVKAMGLKLGIYSDAGTKTCAGYPGSLGFEDIDAQTWTSWGVEYLKYDNCNVPGNWSDNNNPGANYDWYNSNTAKRYRQMGDALARQSTPVLYSLCDWGQANVWSWGARVGHSWRMSGDSGATWSYLTSIITLNAQHLDAVNFYSHNDMDMMEIGNGALTTQEQRTHFAVWAFMKSPILLGTDLSKLTSAQLTIIKNAELLAFSQDQTIGTPAKPFTNAGSGTTSPPEFYSGLSSKGMHVFVINTNGGTTTKNINFASVPGLGSGTFKVHDMWTGKDIGTFTNTYSFSLAAHDTGAFLVTKV